MDPITLIATAISSIKTATEIAQLFRTAEESFINAELKLKLAEMISALADAKIALAELKETILDKDIEIKRLKDEMAVSKKINMFLKNGYYYDGSDGPFCTNCYDAKKLSIRLIEVGEAFNVFGELKCPNCGTFYK